MANIFTGVNRLFYLIIFLLAGVGSAHAAFTPLNLVPGLPDIQSPVQIDVTYTFNAGTGIGTLSAFGGASQLNLSSGTQAISGGVFNLNALIDTNTMSATGGLTINGSSNGAGGSFGDPLLTGALSQFGAGAGDPLEFLFTGLGGSTAALFGESAGVILSNSGFAGSLLANFGTGGNFSASANTAAVPEPGPLAMILLSGVVMIQLSRKINQS